MLGALANDWTLPRIVTLQSGVPVAVTQATNFNAFAGFGMQRPNLMGDPELPADAAQPSALVQHRAFAVAPQFTLGSASRNPVRGAVRTQRGPRRQPALPVGRGPLELRAEIFNLLNTATLAHPQPCSGPPTSAASRPRSIRGSCSSRASSERDRVRAPDGSRVRPALSASIRKSEGQQLAGVAATTDRHDHILLAIDLVGHRRTALRRRHIDRTHLAACRLVERAQHRPALA